MIATRTKPQVTRSEDGYSISGLEPPELAQSHGYFRKMFWGWVVTFGLKEKDRDLAKGLGANGKPLRKISKETRKHRRSAMTPSGKGDPNAPPLTPGWQKSRTRSLLTGRAYEDHAEFFWKFDAFTHDSWSKILEYQVDMGRDVFGLSPKALERTKRQAINRWNQYKKGLYDEPEPKKVGRPKEPKPVKEFGYVNIRGQTIEERIAHFRQTAPAMLRGRPVTPKVMSEISGPKYNVLLAHIHGVPTREGPPPKAKAITVKPPKPSKPLTPKQIIAGAKPTKGDIADWFKAEPKAVPKPAPAAPKVSQPAGKPVSAAFELPLGEYGKKFQSVVDHIDKIHGDGDLNKIPVEVSFAQESNGTFYRKRAGNKIEGFKITISKDSEHQELTLAHEIGHFIDAVGMPSAPSFDQRNRDFNEPLFAEWLSAIEQSSAVKRLKELQTKPSVQIDTDSGPRDYEIESEYVDYILKHNELWARSYAQYIATKSKDPEMMGQLDKTRDPTESKLYHVRQWADDDFKPIAAAIDKLFQAIGWRS